MQQTKQGGEALRLSVLRKKAHLRPATSAMMRRESTEGRQDTNPSKAEKGSRHEPSKPQSQQLSGAASPPRLAPLISNADSPAEQVRET